MAFLRSATATTTSAIAAACVIPVFSTISSRSPNAHNLVFFFPSLTSDPTRFGLVKTFANQTSAIQMHTLAPSSQQDSPSRSKGDSMLPELLTEYVVDMKCEGCVKAVNTVLQTVEGIKSVDVNLNNQTVRILGSTPLKTLTEALEQTGRKARLIGQGLPEDFSISAAVAEFKGPNTLGVVRFAQVNMELTRIEANFSGLSPGTISWSINEYGDLTRGAASTGKIFNPSSGLNKTEPLGDLGTLEVNKDGEAFYSGVKEKLKVADLIGRSVVVYGTEDRSDPGITAAVIARSAGVGENYKRLCTCDGTTIWESSDRDFVASKV